MRTGIVFSAHNRFSYSDARQTVSIPVGVSSAKLDMWVFPASGEPANALLPNMPQSETFGAQALSNDVQYVLLLDRFGNWIDTLLWQRSNAQTWTFHEFDLSAYRGATIKVQFGTFNDGLNGVTSMYVDDVSLQVCP